MPLAAKCGVGIRHDAQRAEQHEQNLCGVYSLCVGRCLVCLVRDAAESLPTPTTYYLQPLTTLYSPEPRGHHRRPRRRCRCCLRASPHLPSVSAVPVGGAATRAAAARAAATAAAVVAARAARAARAVAAARRLSRWHRRPQLRQPPRPGVVVSSSRTSLTACSLLPSTRSLLPSTCPLTTYCLLTYYLLLATRCACLERRLGCSGSQVARQSSLEGRKVGCILCPRRLEHRDHGGVPALCGRRHLCELSKARLKRVSGCQRRLGPCLRVWGLSLVWYALVSAETGSL